MSASGAVERPGDRRALVTGAARGIGAAIVERLTGDGFEVIGIDLIEGQDVIGCDVSDPEAVTAVAEMIGPVEVLVNNAGIWRFGPLEDIDPEEFGEVMDVNVRGGLHCAQTFGRPMLEAGRGSIVNVVSIAGYRANPGVGSYGPSKAALISLTEQIALEWGPRGVRCNAVGPGLIPTPGTAEVYGDAEVQAVRAQAVPLRRLGRPADIADAVSFLVSDRAHYITGQTLYVDGGISKALMPLLPRPPDLPRP